MGFVELGWGVKKILMEINASRACLSKEFSDALELFEKYEQDNDGKPVEYKPQTVERESNPIIVLINVS